MRTQRDGAPIAGEVLLRRFRLPATKAGRLWVGGGPPSCEGGAFFPFRSLFRSGAEATRGGKAGWLLGFGLTNPAAEGRTERAPCWARVICFFIPGSLSCTSRDSRAGTINQSFREMFLSGLDRKWKCLPLPPRFMLSLRRDVVPSPPPGLSERAWVAGARGSVRTDSPARYREASG